MKTVHVAVGILINAVGAVLITRRPEHVHQGGLWEFPGGKVEEGEPVAAALSRELHEELGVTVESAEPWLHVRHDYSDKRVFLDVWR
ncbi:MAG: NUDIX domain-containing protein, partial [Candidatus Competibacteraceae bacterium]|nr:NUDIX domain-containing protein [Candidatus Competibacteraceae bacterium]